MVRFFLIVVGSFKYYQFSFTYYIMQKQVGSWIKMSNYAFKLWVEQKAFPKVLMGFDVGTKFTGVSITSSDLKHAFVDLILL